MASGDMVVRVLQVMYPAANFAPTGVRVGGSTPAENTVFLGAFDAATIEYIDLLCQLVGYGGGGLTFSLVWMAATATTGNVIWGIAIRRIQDDAEDLDTAQTYDFNDSAAVAAPSASGEVSYDTITFTNGVDMDSWADGELAIVRVRRNASSGSDTMAGDAQLLDVSGKET